MSEHSKQDDFSPVVVGHDGWWVSGLPVYSGGKNRSEARAALDGMGWAQSFKTRIIETADGRMIVQTKGTMPPQVRFERRERIEKKPTGNYIFSTNQYLLKGGSVTLSFALNGTTYWPLFSALEPFLVPIEDCKHVATSDGYYPVWQYGPTNSVSDRQHSIKPSTFVYAVPGSGRTAVAWWEPDTDEVDVFIHAGTRLTQNESAPHGVVVPGRLVGGAVGLCQLWHGLTYFLPNGDLRIGEKVIHPLQQLGQISNHVTIYDPAEGLKDGLKNYAVLINRKYSLVHEANPLVSQDYVCADGGHFPLTITRFYPYGAQSGNVRHARVNCSIKSSYPVIFDRATYVTDPANQPIMEYLSQSYPAFDLDVEFSAQSLALLSKSTHYLNYSIELSPNRRKFVVLFTRWRSGSNVVRAIDAAVECTWGTDGSMYELPADSSYRRVENVRDISTHEVTPIYGVGPKNEYWGTYSAKESSTTTGNLTVTTRSVRLNGPASRLLYVHQFTLGAAAGDARFDYTDVREPTILVGYGADNILKTITVRYVCAVNKHPATVYGVGEAVYERRTVRDAQNYTVSDEASVSGELYVPVVYDAAIASTSLQVLMNGEVVWSDERQHKHEAVPKIGISYVSGGITVGPVRRFYYTLNGLAEVSNYTEPVVVDRRFTGEWIEPDVGGDGYDGAFQGASNNACWLTYSIKKLTSSGVVLVERIYIVVTVDGEVFPMTQEDFDASAYTAGIYTSHWVAYNPATRQVSTTPYTTWS